MSKKRTPAQAETPAEVAQAQVEEIRDDGEPPSDHGVFRVQINPCPRILIEAESPAEAISKYRDYFHLKRPDLEPSVERM